MMEIGRKIIRKLLSAELKSVRRKAGSTCGLESVSGRGKIVDQLLKGYEFSSAIDVGCGVGDFYSMLNEKGCRINGVGVDVIDPSDLLYSDFHYVRKNFTEYETEDTFDLVFSSHTIEHVQDTGVFLKKFFSLCREDGVFCLIWPPPKKHIVGGHLHVFNPGLMLYNIVRLGIDCRNVKIFKSGYNLAIMGQFKTFELPELTFNRFELELLSDYFPFTPEHNFDGDLKKIVKVL